MTNIFDFILSVYEFLIDVYQFFYDLWYYRFSILGYDFYFYEILTTLLVVIIGLILVKKLVPAA